MSTSNIISENLTSKNGNGKPVSGLAKRLGLEGHKAYDRHKNDPITGNIESERDGRLLFIIEKLLEADRPSFPIHVFPSLLRQYIWACARSIHCSADLLAGPMLAVAGAAIGRSGRRLRVKDGWDVTSCLWIASILSSSGGKTPALNKVENFYDDRQEAEYWKYVEDKKAYEADPKNNPPPGPYPALKLTDTTIESLRSDLGAGPVLFSRDELGGWCHQMGQYKHGNADRFDWCSFWSHSAVNIGRKSERVYVKEPFVSVTGMMVPASARELNYRGQADDGFVHRILLAFPEATLPRATLEGVSEELTKEYKRRMTRLFDPPGKEGKILTFEPKAIRMLLRWANTELFRELRPLEYENCIAPDWLVSKYRKLFENCLRICLVLHELWRVAGQDHEREDWEPEPRDFYGEQIEFQTVVVDRLTVERAIAVIEYFRGHIDMVHSLVGEVVDDVDRAYNRLQSKGRITVRETIYKTTYKSADRVQALFSEWERRGYGTIENTRKNQTVFNFNGNK